MIALTPILASAMLATGQPADRIVETPPAWAMEKYGDGLEFTIFRDNKKIGRHLVSFKQKDGAFQAQSETKMKVKILFITAYKFNYDSTETWQGNQLATAQSYVNDGGDKMQTLLDTVDQKDMLPTNHWNPNVLRLSRVFNTLTGKPNQVTISKGDWEAVETADGERMAQRFDYSGDLKDVSAWYDEDMRWVGLRFKGRDGSTITYKCERCGL